MNSRMIAGAVAAALLWTVAGGALAQDGTEVSELVVTGSRLKDYDPVETPYVVLRRRADNVITQVRVVCDTRDPSQRTTELKSTLRNIIRAAASDPAIELGSLGDEVVGAFDETKLDSMIRPDSRPDTSAAVLLVKTRVAPADTLESVTGRIEAFIKSTPKVGRTEILRNAGYDLTLIGPERYRAELIGKMAANARENAALFGESYAVSVEGLQRPLSWYQSGPLELALYIPHKLTVERPGKLGWENRTMGVNDDALAHPRPDRGGDRARRRGAYGGAP